MQPISVDKKPFLPCKLYSPVFQHAICYTIPFLIIGGLSLCRTCYADEQSHYEAAYTLVKHVHENGQHAFEQAVVQSVLKQEPLLVPYKSTIEEIINTYFSSREYKEMRIMAVMHYFTEQEVRDITVALKNQSFTYATGRNYALLKKYENVFSRLEQLFIEHIQGKLREKF